MMSWYLADIDNIRLYLVRAWVHTVDSIDVDNSSPQKPRLSMTFRLCSRSADRSTFQQEAECPSTPGACRSWRMRCLSRQQRTG